MALPYRIAALMALVVLAAVTGTALLNYYKFVEVMETLDDSRYAFVARDLKATLEDSLDLGLPLAQIENAQAVVDRELALYPEILSISVFDEAGRVIYYSGRTRRALLLALEKGETVSAERDGERVAAAPLINPFGANVGGVAVSIPAERTATQRAAMRTALTRAVLQSAAVGTVAVALVALFLLRGVRRRLDGLARTLGAIAPDEAGPPGPGFVGAARRALADLSGLERMVDESRRKAPP